MMGNAFKNQKELLDSLIAFILAKNEESENTHVSITNIRIYGYPEDIRAMADVSYTIDFYGRYKHIKGVNILFLYRNNEWTTKRVF